MKKEGKTEAVERALFRSRPGYVRVLTDRGEHCPHNEKCRIGLLSRVTLDNGWRVALCSSKEYECVCMRRAQGRPNVTLCSPRARAKPIRMYRLVQADFNMLFQRWNFTPFLEIDPALLHTCSMSPCQPVTKWSAFWFFDCQIFGRFFFLRCVSLRRSQTSCEKNKNTPIDNGLAGAHRTRVPKIRVYPRRAP